MDDYRNSGRQNQLSQYMDFYKRSAGVPNLSGAPQVDLGPIYNRAALDWAGQQVQQEEQNQPKPHPDFFGQMNGGFRGPQYMTPQVAPMHDGTADMQMRNYLARLVGQK